MSETFASVRSMEHPAAEVAKRAADELNAVLSGEPSGLRQDLDQFAADALRQAIALLDQAQASLRNGSIGDSSAVAEALESIREASDAIESTRGLVRWMPNDVVYARADALRLLDHATGRW